MGSNDIGYQGEVRRPDAQGRITIGKDRADETFVVEPQTNGDIILRSVVVMHRQEMWLFENKKAAASLKRGIAQSRAGKVKGLGPFAEFAELEDEEE